MPMPHPWINQTSASRAVILLYHRIGRTDADPLSLSIIAQHFSEHLQVLKQAYNVITLNELSRILTERENLPSKTIVLTIDDGYRDLLSITLPLLRQFEMKATAFICGGAQDEKIEFWWDTLQNIFLCPGTLPKILEINLNGELLRWELGEYSNYSHKTALACKNWTIESDQIPNVRQLIFKQLHHILRACTEVDKERLIAELKVWSRLSVDINHAAVLSRDEVLDLARTGHLEVGGHTVSHPYLSTLPPSQQVKEITQNKTYLENVTASPITSFAYPYGSEADYSLDTIRMVQDAGYKVACSATPDVVWRGSSLWTLPRIIVRDCDGNTFARWLENWL